MAREDFAAPKVHCREGFERILKGLKLPAPVIEPLYAAYETGERAGDARLAQKLMAQALGQSEWRWPWLEGCAAIFEANNIWPRRWTEINIHAPLAWEHIPAAVKVTLLQRTLSSATWTMVRLHQTKEIGVTKFFVPAIDAYGDKCEVSQIFVRYVGPKIAARDFTNLPPFFPGDMTYFGDKFIKSADRT